MTDSVTQLISSNLSQDPHTEGFDLQAGESWIYPTNYSIRDYQFNIIQKALLKNTLVSLPTGLGKTFIAAVVMFNYFRWYPLGKVVFMAPTRPLVKQQIDACYDIMAIPKEATAEITGLKVSNSREEIWKEKRVFFITPQILQNDLEKFETLGPKIKCVVFDEAHRARGNHAYCEVIRRLTVTNKFFRVLALSATPGGTIEDVLEVVNNLLISHLEFRTEDSLDVRPYVFQRNLTTIVVPLGEKLQQVKDDYMKVLEYDTRVLIRYKVIQGNCANLTRGKIYMLMKNYQQSNRGTSPHYQEIMKCLNICITLYHGAELLVRHGLRSFLTFFDEHIDKPLIRGNKMIREIMADVREYLGPPPQIQTLPDNEYPEVSKDVKFGHPKFYKLRDILLDHFEQSDSSSRVIVFFEYRESVMEAYALLIQSQPVIRPKIFVGQKQGVTQRIQINVVKSFREGTCNVLLSTCIGEEGLDVGDVDLIVCFDISNKSPIRMVQRMGRTGRKKDGQIVVLVTEGKEQQTLKDCLIHKSNVAFHVLGSKQLANGLQTECPRLIPEGMVPKCEKIFITVQKTEPKKTGNLKEMLKTISSSKSSEPLFSSNLQIIDNEEKISKIDLFSLTANAYSEHTCLPSSFNKRIEKQRSFQETHKVEHSEICGLLVSLLQMAESRRFNIPMSQISRSAQNKNFKQADIRNMFHKSQSAKDFVLPTTPSPIITNTQNLLEDKNFGSPALFTEIIHFLSVFLEMDMKRCKWCPPQTECGKVPNKNYSTADLTWAELEPSVYSTLTLDDLKLFEKELNSNPDSFQFEESLNIHSFNTPINKMETTPKEIKVLELEDFIDISFLADVCNKSTNFEAPKSLNNLLNKYSTSINDGELISQKCNKHLSQSSHQEDLLKINREKLNQTFSLTEMQNILNFFNLDCLNRIFENDSIDDSQQTVICSPDMFNENLIHNEREKTPTKIDKSEDDSNSPILCSYIPKKKKSEIRNLTFDRFVKNPVQECDSSSAFTLSRQELTSTPKNQRSMQTFNTSKKGIDQVNNKHSSVERTETTETPRKGLLELEDLFDLSSFGIPTSTGVISLTDSSSSEDLVKGIPPSKSDDKNSNIMRKNEHLEALDFFKDTCNEKSMKSDCTVTQVLHMMSKPTQMNKSSQKENFTDISDLEDINFFNFSFNSKKIPSKSPIRNEQISNKCKRNESYSNNSKDVHSSSSSSDRTLESNLNESIKNASKPPNTLSKSSKLNNSFKFNSSLNGSRLISSSGTTRSKLDESIYESIHNISNSDDEFEMEPKTPVRNRSKVHCKNRRISCDGTSTVWLKPRAQRRIICDNKKPDSEKDTACGSPGIRNKKMVHQFIEDEAVCDISNISDDESESENRDHYDESFVDDESQNINTQMHAVYLESVRSPVCPSRFKIPRKVRSDINVFSQQESTENDTYLDDSFVVHDETIETQHELSELEILEKQLELRRKRKKMPHAKEKASKKRKMFIDSDSD